MKRAIDWLNEVSASPGITQISEVYDLILAVRSEALDAAELLVRRANVQTLDGAVRSILEKLAEDIALMGRKAR